MRPVAFSAGERLRSHFGALRIEGITVEVMGAVQKRRTDGSWEDPVDVARHRTFAPLSGLMIPVLSLEYEYEAYLTLGRSGTAALLRRHLPRRAAVSAQHGS